MGKYQARNQLNLLLTYSEDENFDVQSYAINSLGEIGDERAVEPLINLLKNESWRVRRCSLTALGKIEESPIETFIVALDDIDCHVRERAVDILEKVGDNESLNYLRLVLDDEDADVRERASEILIKLEKSENKHVKDNKNPDEHQRLEETLERIGPEKAVQILIDALEDENPETRHRAAEVLGEIGDKQAVEPLIVALGDQSSSVQWRASEALEKLKEPAVMPLILP